MVFLLTVVMIKTGAQSYEAEQLILDWQKLTEMKQTLSDMYTGYKIVEVGYTTIRDIAHGNFDLHKAFLDGLLAVSPMVRNYYKVAEIISFQLQLVKEYKAAYARFQSDKHFTPDELGYMGTVYGQLFNKSMGTLDALITVLTDGQLRASDDERLRRIDALHGDMVQQLGWLRAFNNRAVLLSLQRAGEEDDIDQVRSFYGLTN